jgi:hypothetical protein
VPSPEPIAENLVLPQADALIRATGADIQGLSGAADINANGLIEVEELQNYLQLQVQNSSREQMRPRVYLSRDNFVLAVPEYSRH